MAVYRIRIICIRKQGEEEQEIKHTFAFEDRPAKGFLARMMLCHFQNAAAKITQASSGKNQQAEMNIFASLPEDEGEYL